MIADTEDDCRKQIILTNKAYQADKEWTVKLLSKQNRICNGISPENFDHRIHEGQIDKLVIEELLQCREK